MLLGIATSELKVTPPFLSNLFSSVPEPLRHVLDTALQVDHLRELHAEARKRGQESLSRSVLELLSVRPQVCPGELGRIPKSGPLIVIANHPFGIIDGLLLDALLCEVRNDVKILTNSLVASAEEIAQRCIPIDVFGSRTSSSNLAAVRRAREWLGHGHALTIFPAGEVSHWRTEQRCISDPPWSDLAVRLAIQTKATVVPIYFAGTNSVPFHLAGFIHPRLRTIQLPNELLNKRGANIDVRIGSPVSAMDLVRQNCTKTATAYLRARTYMLAYRSDERIAGLGHSAAPAFTRRVTPVALETPGVALEIDKLDAGGCKVLENAGYAVYAERGERMTVLLREIARLRELTFRSVGEGTGTALDIDDFDSYYTHLILWHKQTSCIAGAYRLAWTEDVLPVRGTSGLYTSTLFFYAPGFFHALGPGVELGRTFVRSEFQKDYAPLLLLWQAIAGLVASRPQAPVLFGAVSISANYSQAAIELMVEYLRQHRLRPDLTGLVRPRRPFRSRLTRAAEIRLIAACLEDIEELATPLSEISDQSHIPVLLRHYVRLGGRVAAFHVDHKFSNVIDALLVVDLRETAPKLLAKYMGREGATNFLRQASVFGGSNTTHNQVKIASSNRFHTLFSPAAAVRSQFSSFFSTFR